MDLTESEVESVSSFHSCQVLDETDNELRNAASTSPQLIHRKAKKNVVVDDSSSDESDSKVLNHLPKRKNVVVDDEVSSDEDESSPEKISKNQQNIKEKNIAVVDGVTYLIDFGNNSLLTDGDDASSRVENQANLMFDVEASEDESYSEEEVEKENGNDAVNFIWSKTDKVWSITAGDLSFRLSSSVGDTLYDYQRDGVSFMLRIWQSKMGGGILADDMGMGKTNQTVAAICTLFCSNQARNAIIIVPLAVLSKWRDLLAKQLGESTGQSIFAYHGPTKDKTLLIFKTKGERGVFISTFETAQSNIESLRSIHWDLLVVDEASKIKNFKSQGFKSLRLLASSAKRRLCITGTPYENALAELWALFDFACDGKLFGPYENFTRIFASRIERSQNRGTSERDRSLGLRLSHELSKAIEPYILRRDKSLLYSKPCEDDQRMPEKGRPKFESRKVDLLIWVQLSNEQRAAYKLFLESEEVSLALNQTQSPLAALTVLKKICDDVRLVPNASSIRVDEKQGNAKLKVLMALLQDVTVDGGHKVVIFSNSKAMLGHIESAMEHQFRGDIRHVRVDGDLKVEDRQKRIKAFNQNGGEDVLLLTTGVGALGIEVTGADRVVIFDPHWNPAIDDQAIDRAFRIGQTKQIVVSYRLVSVGTVEEKMTRIQLRKSALARNILNRESQRAYSSVDDLRDLFKLSEPDDPGLLLKVIEETCEKSMTESVQEKLSMLTSERDVKEVMAQLVSLREGGDSQLGQMRVAGAIEGASDRAALFSGQQIDALEDALEGMTLDEKQQTEKIVEDAMGWLSAKKKKKPQV